MTRRSTSFAARSLAGILALTFFASGEILPARAQERQASGGALAEVQRNPVQTNTTGPSSELQAQIEYGRRIAVSQCSSCHALDNEDQSPNPAAPPLRSALWRFAPDPLATYFIEALRVGHGDMPIFDFTPIGADALIAYLKSIKTPHDVDQK